MAVSTRNSSKRRSHASAASAASKRRRRRTGARGGNARDGGASRRTDDASVVSDDASPDILISPRQDEFSERTWWMVDVEHGDNEEEGSNQGATALVKRCVRSHGWNLEKARKILTAYRQFLTLKKEREDWDATILSPSLLVDQMWHQHILDVVNYCHDMMLLCGRVVGHNPGGAMSGKAERDEIWGLGDDMHSTVESSDATYESDSEWNSTISINPITLRLLDKDNGEVSPFAIDKYSKLGTIFDAFALRKGVPVSDLHFKRDQESLTRDGTPEGLGLGHYQTLVVIHNKPITINIVDADGRKHAFAHKMNEGLQPVFDAYARNREVHRFQTKYGFTCDGCHTPSSLGLGDGARIIAKSRADYYKERISIRVVDQRHHWMTIKIRGTARIRHVFDLYVAQKDLCRQSLRFLLDGERIDPDQTLESLDLEDGDQIDVIFAQVGC